MKILFVSTEIWSEKNPEGIVARKVVLGLIENGCSIDLVTTHSSNIREINREYIIEDKSIEILSKIMKKISGIEKKEFVNLFMRNYQQYDINQYDIIITRSEPFYLHEIGWFVKKKYPQIKWIASFGDPVFLNPYNSRSFLKRKIAKKLEEKYWEKSDLVTHTNNTVIEEYAKNGFDVKKAIVLENPFILSNKKLENKKVKQNDAITFAYIGSLYGRRNIKPVIKFLSKINFNFELLIIGGVRNTYYENRFGWLTNFLIKKDTKKILKPIKEYNLIKNVRILPFMNKENLDKMIEENIDILINIDAYVGDKNLFLSSKIVEYLQYNKPILNFSTIGASVDFLKEVGVEYFIDISSKEMPIMDIEMLQKLIPSQNIEYFTSQQICKRLINSIQNLN